MEAPFDLVAIAERWCTHWYNETRTLDQIVCASAGRRPSPHVRNRLVPRVCFYCNSAATDHQLDHFPVPRSRGGTTLVRACNHCHNLKDRVSRSSFNDYFWSGEILSMGRGDAMHSVVVDHTILSAHEGLWLIGDLSLTDPRVVEMFFSDWFAYSPRVRLMAAREIGCTWAPLR